MKTRKLLVIIIAVSVLFRIAAAFYMGDEVTNLPGTNDQISYHTLALRVIDGHGFSFGEGWWPVTAADAPTAHWSFIYTLFLTLVYTLFGTDPMAARLIQAILVGIIQPLLVFSIGSTLFNESVGLVSAAITAVYVYFIYYAAALMTEPFFICAVLAVILLALSLVRILGEKPAGYSPMRILLQSAVFGLLLGCTVLLRQVFLMFVPLLFLWMLWVLRKAHFLKAIGVLTISGVMVTTMVLPITYYNYTRFNKFVLLNTNAGYAFFFANHPIYGTHFEPILPAEMGHYDDLVPTELRQLDEAALDQALLARGIRFVIEDPLRYLLLSASRIPVFFMFWPSSESGIISNLSRVGSFGLFWPFMVYGTALTLFSKERKFRLTSPVSLLLAFSAAYIAIHIFSWALIRYRLPVDAVMIIFAGLALVHIYQRIREGTKHEAIQSESVNPPVSASQRET